MDVEIIKKLEYLLNGKDRGYSEFRFFDYTFNTRGQVTQLHIDELPIKNLKLVVDLIAQLKKLNELSLRNNNLKNIKSLERLTQLRVLTITESPISDITPLGKLINLKRLSLYEMKVKDIRAVSLLKKLQLLEIAKTPVKDISPIGNLTNLKTLWLYDNKIDDISPLQHLSNLVELTLTGNPISSLPIWITDFKMRVVWENGHSQGALNFFENPIKAPPIEIIKQGNQAIKNYFAQIKKEKNQTDYLFEAKLLVLGEGGCGKTTFTRKIQNVDAEMPKDKDTTLGIHVGTWTYPVKFPKLDARTDFTFNVNLWDFGGQKIYQGTHQMFFSDKSFYALIADTREQKTDFSYWLNTVEQLGGADSSLMIVLNKKHGHEIKFDESGYRNHFGKLIKDVVQLDLQNDKPQLYEMQETVKAYLKQLPGIGDPLPPSWVAIREDLLKEDTNFITFDRFKDICKKHAIVNASMIHTISGYFNRIGAFTHYIDDPILQERIYLNSNWLVKTVYEVLDNETAKTKKGRLSGADVKTIWGNNDLHYEVGKLTQLMHNFGLMYRVAGKDEYVIPAHLPTITPYTDWPHANDGSALRFIYEFDKYMPQGIMSRLIVALHHHIKNHDLVWHRGVNIEIDGASAEIIESYGGTNSFEIRIAGTNKVELLAIIRERFEEILKPFSNLQYKQMVPCMCAECKHSDKPAFHEYGLLIKYREKGRGSQCTKTGEVISADDLLMIVEIKVEVKLAKRGSNGRGKTIKLFLASSSELKEDRKDFEVFIQRENERLNDEGIFIKLERWERFIDAMSKTRLQDEYNRTIEESHIFVSLFFTKVGKYTNEEFTTAFGKFKETGKPKVYTYFKKAIVDVDELNETDIKSKFAFERKLKKLGHFKSTYKNIDDLKYQVKTQLDLILPKL